MTTKKILSPVTGSVWKLECSVGQVVSEGDVLMVLESMKMEIPLEAPVSGRIESLAVAEGDAVDEDAVMGVIVS